MGLNKKVYDGANKSREPDELILYTPAYGEKTHTNEWGGEIVIENNTVISKIGAMGINNSTIPENGFVLSGHGKGADWLSHNIRLLEQIEIARENKTKGVCLFALCSMTQEQMKALKMGAFRK